MPLDIPPCTGASASRALAIAEQERVEALHAIAASAERESRDATELLTIILDAVGFDGVETFLAFLDARGSQEIRRRLGNIARMLGRS